MNHSGDNDRFVEVRNPRTGDADYRLRMPTATEIETIVRHHRSCQPAWEARGLGYREDTLRHLASLLANSGDELVVALARDTGRKRVSAMEVASFGDRLEQQIAIAESVATWAHESIALAPGCDGMRSLAAYPLVVNLTPWNFPFSLGFLDTVPALLAGCSVIVKPSEIAPRFVEPLMALVNRVPQLAGILSFVPGDALVAEALIDHADFVCLTGSTTTGRKVYRRAAERFIPVCLELGGKDTALVMADAPVDATAKAVVMAATIATGQICTSAERALVDRRIHDQFADACTSAAASISLDIDDPDGGGLGPFIREGQAEVFLTHIDDAVDKGARILCGGSIVEQGGLWAPATVLVDVGNEMLIMQEETFGPVLPIMAFEDLEDAVRLANDNRYGLGAAVFGRDREACSTIARRLRAGAVAINGWDPPRMFKNMEFDAFGDSGLGASRGGAEGILRFTRRQMLTWSDPAVLEQLP